MIRVSLQGRMKNAQGWLSLARNAEELGFDTLYVADHPGTSPAPLVALSAAAAVTDRIRLGTCVINAGRWDPLALANEIATLDVLSNGRALLGIGAGHTPVEWSMAGLEIPSPAHRVTRMIEMTNAVRSLLAGETVTTQGDFVTLNKALLSEPKPTQNSIPLMIGGNGSRLMRFASENAEIVGVSGLGKTLADGHSHEVDWRVETLDRKFERITSLATARDRKPSVEALVQYVHLTDDPESVANDVAKRIPGAKSGDLLNSPFIWIGTSSAIVAQLRNYEQRWNITRYVIREDSLDQAGEIVRIMREES